MKLSLVWKEVMHAARQAPMMYFAPFRGAWRGARATLRRLSRENGWR